MESSEWRFGWAADDPRWDDAHAGGSGRLEPTPPPAFGVPQAFGVAPAHSSAGEPQDRARDAPLPDPGRLTTDGPDAGAPNTGGADSGTPRAGALNVNAPDSVGDGFWPAAPAAPPTTAPTPEPPATLASAWDDAERLTPFSAPLALTSAAETGWETGSAAGGLGTPSPRPAPLQPAFGTPVTAGPAAGYGMPPWDAPPVGVAALGVPAIAGPPAVYGDPAAARTKLFLPAAGANPGELMPAESAAVGRSTRLDRQVRLRRRWRRDDEFSQATRAELLSDDARYRVLFTLTACWYVPVIVVFFAWTLAKGDGSPVAGLLWLAGAVVLSLAIAALLRWAQVSWRAVTLSFAAAVIGGAVATVAHTLST